jgi:hypothetical protein
MEKQFSEAEENLIKDIFKYLSNRPFLTMKMAESAGVSRVDFNNMADAIFNKCQNGRLTVETT